MIGQSDSAFGSTGFSANGVRDTANRYYIDGIESMDGDAFTYAFSPSIDSLAEMKIRTAFRHIAWPYLYDGETQGVSIKYGVVATPHIYLFDQQRKLQYQGRIDDNQREDQVKSQDARNAIDAMLGGRAVPVTETHAFGCTTKWMSKATGVEEEWAKIQAEPVTLDPVGVEDLKKLRANGTGKVLLVSFWSTSCPACVSQFLDLETTYRMYRLRSFDFVTVATNPPPVDAPANANPAVGRFAHFGLHCPDVSQRLPGKPCHSANDCRLQCGLRWDATRHVQPGTAVSQSGS